jgi:hypothetical protein
MGCEEGSTTWPLAQEVPSLEKNPKAPTLSPVTKEGQSFPEVCPYTTVLILGAPAIDSLVVQVE